LFLRREHRNPPPCHIMLGAPHEGGQASAAPPQPRRRTPQAQARITRLAPHWAGTRSDRTDRGGSRPTPACRPSSWCTANTGCGSTGLQLPQAVHTGIPGCSSVCTARRTWLTVTRLRAIADRVRHCFCNHVIPQSPTAPSPLAPTSSQGRRPSSTPQVITSTPVHLAARQS